MNIIPEGCIILTLKDMEYWYKGKAESVYMEGCDKAIMDVLARQGGEDVREAFEAIHRAVAPLMNCRGPSLDKDQDGRLLFSMLFFGLKDEDSFLKEVLWKERLEEEVRGTDVAGAAKRLAGKIAKRFPELRTEVAMLLRLKGFDAEWI